MNLMQRVGSIARHCCTRPVVQQTHSFSTTSCLNELRLMSKVKIADNSMIGRRTVLAGKKAKIIHVYTRSRVGRLGDKVLVAIMGEKKRGYIVGCVQDQKPGVPRYDSNHVVLIEENGAPTGTRIRVPLPSVLRGKEGDFTKLLSLGTKFI